MTAASERLTVALADRYLIERELGHGGMATVYLAGVPQSLFSTAGLNTGFDVAADGRFLMVRQRPDRRRPTSLVMLERWTDLLPQ